MKPLKLQPGHSCLTVMTLLTLLAFSCKSETKTNENVPVVENTSLSTETESNPDQMNNVKENKESQTLADTVKQTQVSLPSPKVELPELSYDKKKLSKIQLLDEMLTDAEIVKVASAQFGEMFDELKSANEYGYLNHDGTLQDAIRKINKVADSFKKFDQTGKVLGEKILTFVREKYQDNSQFTSRYREIYSEAEEQVNEVIADNVLRRKVGSEMMNSYRIGTDMSTYFVESKLEDAIKLKSEVISSLLSSANTDLLISDYKKGKELTDLLAGTTSMLNALQSLHPAESELASIEEMKTKVADTRNKRIAEIAKAREERRFPDRYSSGNAPANAAELEKRMETYLEKSFYNGKDKYDVRKIVVAGPWIEVRSILGVVMYYQIDFYVATKYKHNEAGVIDVELVTGKTNSANMNNFSTFSIGGLGDMLEKNLN